MSEPTALATLLSSGSGAEKRAAAEELARLEADAQPAAVALVQALDEEDDELRDWVVAALEGLGPPQPDSASELAQLAVSPGLDSAYWAATLLGRLGPQAATAVPALIESLTGHPELVVRERAAWALGKIGPPAAAARAPLEHAAKSEHPRLARTSTEALQQIGG